jgi:uncharacterized protein involved in exopolysaccharide biosynthesis/Mrp family chromosome partitioning ATPase
LEFRTLWEILTRRGWLVLWAFATVVAVTIVACLAMNPVHEAVARVKIESKDSAQALLGALPNEFGELNYISPTASITAQETMNSGLVTERVIDKLKLRKRSNVIIDTLQLFGLGKVPDERLRADYLCNPGIVISFLQNRQYFAEVIEDTDIVEVYAYDRDVDGARELANAVAETYLEVAAELKRNFGETSVASLEEHARLAKVALEAADRELEAFQKKEGVVAMDQQNIVLVNELSDLDKGLNDTDREMDRVRSVMNALGESLKTEEKYELFSTTELANPVMESLKTSRAALLADLADLLVTKQEAHPKVIELRGRIKAVEGQILGEMEKTVSGELSRLEVQRESTARQIDDHWTKMKAWPENQFRYATLKREVDLRETTYTNLLGQVSTAKLAAETVTTDAMIVQRAATPDPTNPYYPQTVLFVIISVFVGSLVAPGLALFVEYTDESLCWESAVETSLGAPILGTVPKTRRSRLEKRPTPEEDLPLFQSYVDLGNRVRVLVRGDETTLLVTSPAPREGKSAVTALVARYLASAGLRTVVVDLNPHRPGAGAFLGVGEHAGGLSGLLDGSLRSPEESLQPTELPNLHVIPRGPDPHAIVEGVYSERFRDLIAWLRGRFDAVLLDAAPVSEFRGHSALAALAGRVILVVRMRSTSQSAAIAARQYLESSGARMVGVVATYR